jgi:glycosyltransferase involved in cell wall biosynthesis
MNHTPRVLIIPDAYDGVQSGSLVAMHLTNLMIRLGWKVGIFSSDVVNSDPGEKTPRFRRAKFRQKANFIGAPYTRELKRVLDEFKPTHVFSAGGVTNRPLSYFDLIEDYGIPHLYLIFMQDFYCSRIHAALPDGPCRKCLDGSLLNAFANGCATKTKRNKVGFLASNTIHRLRIRARIRRVTRVLGSTEEQLGFLEDYGVERSQLVRFPLPFPRSRIGGVKGSKGNEIVIAGQDRIEKGIHLLRELLEDGECPPIVIAFASKKEETKALVQFGLLEYVASGRIRIVFDVSWDRGLRDLYASSLGILILSLWPTTTEYAFLEAIGLGKPVVCFDLGIHRERIINRKNGLKSQVGDLTQLRENLNDLKNVEGLYETISKGALNLFEDLTGEECMMRSLSNLIR